MKVLSWNVLHPYYAEKHSMEQSKYNRVEAIINSIEEVNPDIGLFQEVSEEFISALKSRFTTANIVVSYRSRKRGVDFGCAIVIFNNYELKKFFELTFTHNSVCTVAILKAGDIEFNVASLHLIWSDDNSKEKSLEDYYDLLDGYVNNSKLFIIGGDFNENLSLKTKSLTWVASYVNGFGADLENLNLNYVSEIANNKAFDTILHNSVDSIASEISVIHNSALSDHAMVLRNFAI